MVDSTKPEEEIQDKNFIEEPAQLDKYKAAAQITDAALLLTQKQLVDGADIYTVCQAVDAFMTEELTKVYCGKKTKKTERGIAFPCCISLNNVVGHYSPLADESSKVKDGDVAKVVVGVHIDGFPAVAATTLVIGAGKVAGPKANVIMACHQALRAAERLIKEGATNQQVTAAIAKIAEEYEVKPLDGVLSHEVKKYCLDGNKVIINKEGPMAQVEKWEFAKGEVIHVDIYMSTGEGEPRLAEHRSTVYKRQIQNMYNLKLQKSRAFFAESTKRFPSLPFSMRAFEDQIGAKVGVKECCDHELLQEFPVLSEKDADTVAQFKSTVLLMPSSTTVICGGAVVDEAKLDCSKTLKDEEMVALVKSDLWKKK